MVTEQLKVHASAERLLSGNGYFSKKVLSVDPDSILFIDRFDRARTAWIFKPPGRPRVLMRVVAGFEVDPPLEWQELLARYRRGDLG